MTVFNEFDPGKAEWLRELIKAGLIAKGSVDERSIEDIAPDDLRRFRSVHLFAGIGIWSYALRLAGWPDSRPVWTCSCPCQPFSSAGKGGGFGDERHLWPAAFHLIRECRPGILFGEQVASNDGLAWLDLVQADLEAVGYTVGAVVTPAAGFGAPHGRHRIYWVADAELPAGERQRSNGRKGLRKQKAKGPGPSGGLGVVDDSAGQRTGYRNSEEPISNGANNGILGAAGEAHLAVGVALGNANGEGQPIGTGFEGNDGPPREQDGRQAAFEAGPVNGFWRDAEWVWCLPEPRYPEGSWRPVEPGTFPLAHGATSRVVKLRGYGDGIVATQAAAFIQAYLEERNRP